MALQIARLVAVVALLCAAAAVATPKGRLPLALRGLAKMVGRCEGEKVRRDKGPYPLTLSPSHPLTLSPSHPLTLSPSHPSARKRGLAFALVLLAILLCLI